jgi:hypothetical protein
MSLIVSADQHEEMGVGRFLNSFTGLLCQTLPEAKGSLNTPDGQRILREQYAKATGYGFRSEREIARYLLTAWLLGSDFDKRYPAMAGILLNRAVPPAQRAADIGRLTVQLFETLEGKASQ